MPGKILHIDLGTQQVKEELLAPDLFRKFYGGSGMGAWLLSREQSWRHDPLSPQAPLVLMAGLLTGIPLPCACKVSFCARSPQTGIWGEATVGGFFGFKLKSTGYDGLIITGASQRPVYLYINESRIEFKDAGQLWGQDCFATTLKIHEELGSKPGVACIGPAGENLVKFASINCDGTDARAAGRTGMGTVMGAKRLKAIVLQGRQAIPVADLQAVKALIRQDTETIKANTSLLHDFGTSGALQSLEQSGDLPIKNWLAGDWKEGAAKICGQELVAQFLVKHYACFACPIRCSKIAKVPSGAYKGEMSQSPQYETVAAFGSLCLNADPGSIVAANDLCNRLGLDTISAGAVIAFAIDAFTRGKLSLQDTDNLELTWGNHDAMLKLIPKIARREGFGAILAEGSKIAAQLLGRNTAECAVETKGLEYAFHDPRAYTSMAISYATANRGACHLEGLTYFVDGGALPAELLRYTPQGDRFDWQGKAELGIKMHNFMDNLNALGLCKFIIRGKIGPEKICAWLKAAFGWEVDFDEFMATGDRIHTLKRMYNVRLGISRKDDTLPPRLSSWSRPTGAAAGKLPHIGKLLEEYYAGRGWDDEGIPTAETLSRLGLAEITPV